MDGEGEGGRGGGEECHQVGTKNILSSATEL